MKSCRLPCYYNNNYELLGVKVTTIAGVFGRQCDVAHEDRENLAFKMTLFYQHR